jgi:class 3 adenylate cyclase
MTAPKRRFQRKLAAVLVFAAIAPVIAIGFVLVDVNRGTLRERSQELLFAVTDDVAHVTSGALDDARRQLAAIALMLGDPTLPAGERIASARALVAAGTHMPVAIYDEAGAQIDSILVPGSSWLGGASLSAELRERALRDGSALGDVGVVDSTPAVQLVVPIYGRAVKWFAMTTVTLAPLADRLVAMSRDRFGGNLEAVSVVDAQHRLVVGVDPERTLAPASMDVLQGLDEAAIRAGILVFREVDGKGGGSVGVVRSLPGLPWAVVAQMPRSEVYAAADHARRLVLIAVAIAALLALGAALWWSHRAARPIRALVDLARDLGRRKFDRKIVIDTGDELETLGEAMTTAARELDVSERKLRDETAIRAQLGRYLPEKLVERIVVQQQPRELASDRRTITVLFADIAAFTALAEREPPDRVVALLNELFTMLTQIVFRHGGTVDKLIGDCLMAFWGAPDDQPDHAKRAVAAAVDMQRWLDVANDCWESSLGLTIHVAIGVHSGDAIVGNLGSVARMEYTCVGDTVNVAARLESLARPQQILISEATRAELDPAMRCARIGKRHLPGRMAPVELHEVLL